MSGLLVPLDKLNHVMDNNTADVNDDGTNGIEDKKGIATLAASFLLYKIGMNHRNFLLSNNVFFRFLFSGGETFTLFK